MVTATLRLTSLCVWYLSLWLCGCVHLRQHCNVHAAMAHNMCFYQYHCAAKTSAGLGRALQRSARTAVTTIVLMLISETLSDTVGLRVCLHTLAMRTERFSAKLSFLLTNHTDLSVKVTHTLVMRSRQDAIKHKQQCTSQTPACCQPATACCCCCCRSCCNI